MEKTKPYTNENGFTIVDEIPEGFRPATEDDYYKKRFYNGRAFLIKSATTGKYECHRVKGTIPSRILIFLEEGDRVWIYDKQVLTK